MPVPGLLLDLTGQVALVTGGSKGIGAATAKMLAIAGADVVVNYRSDEAGAREVVSEIEAAGRRAVAVNADVGRYDEVERMVEATVDRLGRLDILVNNAGVTVRHSGTVLDLPRAAWESVVQVNLNGTFYCSQLAARAIVRGERGGAIVNVSSVHAVITSAHGKATAYPATKAAISMFTKSLAVELAPHRVRVNAVAPGLVITPVIGDHPEDRQRAYRRRIPMGRAGTVEEIARVVVFLASEAASYMTGETVLVDGGYAVDGTLAEVRAGELD